MTTFRPMLACDADISRIKFPCFAQPKIDGVRGLVLPAGFAGVGAPALVGRTLKPFANWRLTLDLSTSEFAGLDFEMCYGDVTDARLCNATTSAVNTIEGPGLNDPRWRLVVYDDISQAGFGLSYYDRLASVRERAAAMKHPSIRTIPNHVVQTPDDIDHLESAWTQDGFEGVILRDPESTYRYGRCTARSGELLRIKRFTDAEAVIESVEEARENQNEAKVNALGLTERSAHQANLVGKSMLGAFICIDRATGKRIRVGPGKSTHLERWDLWRRRAELPGQVVKYKFFDKGVKDAPRFAVFLSFRAPADTPAIEDEV